MINRIKALLAKGTEASAEASAATGEEDELRLAAAALLVEAAHIDGQFEAVERDRICRLLASEFALEPVETETLVAAAEAEVRASGQLYAFTRVIKDRYSAAQRIGMIEMLWEVAYADGRLDHFESNLIRRVGGLIYVSDRDRGEARKRVMQRLGISGTPV